MADETEIDEILEHLRESVKDGQWFEINEASAAVLLEFIEDMAADLEEYDV